MRGWIALLVAGAGCDQLFDIPRYSSNAGGYRKTITIQNPGPAISDFAVNVQLSGDADLAAHARSDGGDLVFGDDTAVYDSEIVHYDAGSLDAWVRVPTIAAAPARTTFFIAYGGALRSSSPTATWASPFVAAWHLADPDTMLRDSGPNLNRLVPGAATSGTWNDPRHEPGVAGAGRRFDGSAQLYCNTDANGDFELGIRSFSYSEWVRVDAGSTLGVTLHKGGDSAPQRGFDLEVTPTSANANLADGARQILVTGNEPTLDTAWTQLAVVVDRDHGIVTLLVNGSSNTQGLGSLGSVSEPTTPVCLTTNDGASSFSYHGAIDEPRIYDRAMPATWFALEYSNLTQRDQFLTIGPEQPR